MGPGGCIFCWSMTHRRKNEPKERKISQAESELWKQAVEGATPLAATDRVSQDPAPRPTAQLVPASRRTAFAENTASNLAPNTGLDKKTAQKLKKGRIPIERRLDLHGMTRDEACKTLHEFIADAWADERRCLLVITGKGLKLDGEIGSLRRETPLWLNMAPSKARVMAFCQAAPKDGGSGALYVLLRKNR
jgi:DNA-nicking Smr family endonuclease